MATRMNTLAYVLAAAVMGPAALRPAHAAVTLSENWSLPDIAKVAPTALGDTISKVGYPPGGGAGGGGGASWHKATAPGTVLTSLVNNGVSPEPLYGENNRPDKIPESLCRT